MDADLHCVESLVEIAQAALVAKETERLQHGFPLAVCDYRTLKEPVIDPFEPHTFTPRWIIADADTSHSLLTVQFPLREVLKGRVVGLAQKLHVMADQLVGACSHIPQPEQIAI